MLRGIPLLFAVFLGTTNAGPCDIYKAGNTPCVAAHSTVRALLDEFTGPMYQLTRASDSKTLDIKPLKAGGIADAASQDKFCEGTTCVISIIYDQSGKENHLTSAPAGGNKPTPDDPANANSLPLTINGQKAYAVWIDVGNGYRNDKTNGIATGDEAEAIYMVTNGTHFNDGCCFDYGNAEIDNNDDGAATMEALYFGNSHDWSYGEGAGPWVMADLENGLFGCASNGQCSNTPSVQFQYVTAMLKGRSGGTFALKQGNAQSGKLQTTYDGARPSGYEVMQKQGAIILGIGGDNSNAAIGSFYEGVMVSGNPSDAVDEKVQANIVAAGYGSGSSA
ncbi:Alpha-L-arabinofuranosidase B [Phytophthora cinnamomi]|uniref:Alpha-L-arabinofuranosidase B n=1 Tax=Phytophthora cinnamomi TaxID=4785 RepID=UPI00355AA11D|nr:Alpha-L-arabinofuranosidase B [Phytophthora cinnamomi]